MVMPRRRRVYVEEELDTPQSSCSSSCVWEKKKT